MLTLRTHAKWLRPELSFIGCNECGWHIVLDFNVKKEDSVNYAHILYKCPDRKIRFCGHFSLASAISRDFIRRSFSYFGVLLVGW